MDVTGIQVAIETCIEVVLKSTRGIGRSQAIINFVRNGDIIICENPNVQKDYQRRLQEKNTKAKTVICEANLYALTNLRYTSDVFRGFRGNVLFDHNWLVQYYATAVNIASQQLTQFQDQYSRGGWSDLDIDNSKIASADLNQFFNEPDSTKD